MLRFRHYSFDLWLTLIRSNPAFKKERANYFRTRFNPAGKPADEVEHIFRQVDLMTNIVNEKTGLHTDAGAMYLMVMYQLGNSAESMREVDMAELFSEMETLFFSYPPVIYNPETLTCLDRLSNNSDITLNILSNTGFVNGDTLRKLLVQLGIADYFSFQLYSNETGLSKPNPGLFQILCENIKAYRPDNPVLPGEIVHIGDNPVADVAGAEAAGLQAFLVNSNNRLITRILD